MTPFLLDKPRRPSFEGRQWHPVARILPSRPRRFTFIPTDDEVAQEIRSVPTHRSSFGTNTWPELFFSSKAAFTAVANTTTETTLLGGANLQPTISPPTFAAVPGSAARCLSFKGWGLLGTTTGPPTVNLKFYLNTTQGSSSLAGTVIGSTGALTTVASQTNQIWKFELDLICQAPGQGTGNATVFASGHVMCSGGLASPFFFPITPGGGNSSTVTATLDGSLTQFFNMSATWSAANAANTITLESLQAWGWN